MHSHLLRWLSKLKTCIHVLVDYIFAIFTPGHTCSWLGFSSKHGSHKSRLVSTWVWEDRITESQTANHLESLSLRMCQDRPRESRSLLLWANQAANKELSALSLFYFIKANVRHHTRKPTGLDFCEFHVLAFFKSIWLKDDCSEISSL